MKSPRFNVENLRRDVPKLALVLALGLTAACSEAEATGTGKARIFPPLGCDTTPNNSQIITYQGMWPGDVIHFGHSKTDNNTLYVDASAVVGQVGEFGIFQNTGRNSLSTIQPAENGVQVTADDESYHLQSKYEALDTLQVTIDAKCV